MMLPSVLDEPEVAQFVQQFGVQGELDPIRLPSAPPLRLVPPQSEVAFVRHTVYLAGPIAGLDYEGATSWRDLATRDLAAAGIKALSPMRAKEFLRDRGKLTNRGYEENPLSTERAIMTRDRFDATRCDVMLVNFAGAERISVGTVMECAWADLSRTPIVCVMEPGNVHEHAMLCEALGFRAAMFEEGLDVVKAILS